MVKRSGTAMLSSRVAIRTSVVGGSWSSVPLSELLLSMALVLGYRQVGAAWLEQHSKIMSVNN
jgi:hypothetical protein